MGDSGNFKKKMRAVLDIGVIRRKITAALSVNKVFE